MDLFVVRRYEGEEHAEQGLQEKENQEQKILGQLNARKKKKTILQATPSPEEFIAIETYPTQPESEQEPRLKLKRKTKSKTEEAEDVHPKQKKCKSLQQSDIEVELDSPEGKIRKKKRKKKISTGDSKTEDNEDSPIGKDPTHPAIPTDLEELPADSIENPESDSLQIGDETGFTIVGEVEKKDQEQVRRVLPKWLSHPSIVTGSLQDRQFAIQHLSNLHPYLAKRLIKSKITHFFPVQRQVLPYLMEGLRKPNLPKNDICVSAPTGSGKTLAFVIPILQALFNRTQVCVRALIVAPVADLAVQIYRVFASFSATEKSKIKVALLAGQLAFNQEQKVLCRKGKNGKLLPIADIVVATPGRLLDHIQRTPGFDLSHLQFIVLDEADRILEEASADWLQTLQKAWQRQSRDCINGQRFLGENHQAPPQKLLFSATLTQDPEKLSRLGLFQPKLFTTIVEEQHTLPSQDDKFVGKFTTPAELVECCVTCESTVKPLLVYHYLQDPARKPALCFANSRQATHRLAVLLRSMGGLRVEEFSANLTKKKRSQILRSFAAGELDVLVTTDAVARGMDWGVVDCVISYDPPPFIKNYVHRVGRCARAGRQGTALAILTPDQVHEFMEMLEKAEKYNVQKLEISDEDLSAHEDEYRRALATLRGTIADERESNIQKSEKARRKGRFTKSDQTDSKTLNIKKKKNLNMRRQHIKQI